MREMKLSKSKGKKSIDRWAYETIITTITKHKPEEKTLEYVLLPKNLEQT